MKKYITPLIIGMLFFSQGYAGSARGNTGRISPEQLVHRFVNAIQKVNDDMAQQENVTLENLAQPRKAIYRDRFVAIRNEIDELRQRGANLPELDALVDGLDTIIAQLDRPQPSSFITGSDLIVPPNSQFTPFTNPKKPDGDSDLTDSSDLSSHDLLINVAEKSAELNRNPIYAESEDLLGIGSGGGTMDPNHASEDGLLSNVGSAVIMPDSPQGSIGRDVLTQIVNDTPSSGEDESDFREMLTDVLRQNVNNEGVEEIVNELSAKDESGKYKTPLNEIVERVKSLYQAREESDIYR